MKNNYKRINKLKAWLSGAALLTAAGLSAQPGYISQMFSFTGAMQTFTVPACVASVTIMTYGAEGVGSDGFAAGKGGGASGVLSVLPGQVLNIFVGGQNGYNGGGSGLGVANGGGASDVRFGGTAIANRIIVAGGGGGAGGDNWDCNSGSGDGGAGSMVGTNFIGGAGGGGYTTNTGCGSNGANNGGIGGNGVHGGGGGGGGLSSGGTGATAAMGSAGNGGLGVGGGAWMSPSCCNNTGGGGGGYYGGGGAAGECCGAGRGGGGSSWTGTLASPSFTGGGNMGDGKVYIIYTLNTLVVANTHTFLCLGQTATLTASGTQSYTWTSGGNTISNATSITVSPAVTTTYSMVATNIAGCTYTSGAVIAVNTLTMSAGANTVVCFGKAVTVSGSGSNTYNWTNANWANGIPFQTISFTPSVSSVYTVSGIDANNCLISNTVSVGVNLLPVITASVNRVNACIGESVSLSSSGANTYTWSNGTQGTPASVVVAANLPVTYSVLATDNNGCNNSAFVVVNGYLCTGIDEAAVTDAILNIYPNPNTGAFNITSEVAIDLVIVNTLGQNIKTVSIPVPGKKTMVEGLTPGIYFISGSSEGQKFLKKIIVE